MTYEIVRFYAPGRDEEDFVVTEVETLEEAQAWCRRKDTHEPGVWFDGYRAKGAGPTLVDGNHRL